MKSCLALVLVSAVYCSSVANGQIVNTDGPKEVGEDVSVSCWFVAIAMKSFELQIVSQITCARLISSDGTQDGDGLKTSSITPSTTTKRTIRR